MKYRLELIEKRTDEDDRAIIDEVDKLKKRVNYLEKRFDQLLIAKS
ncbi:MAG: hypothetical protein NTW50_04820 [Candidatus Berkelbacteria bacterium]|nr:hypothetical protein [Candidatus Berkelbacteria bacterium]